MANTSLDGYWALQDLKDDPSLLANPFHMAVLMGYAETYGHAAAAALIADGASMPIIQA